MTGNRELVYWDSCLFIAWMNDEKRDDPLDMQGIEEQVDLLRDQKIQLATSVISLTEILESTIRDKSRDILKQVFQRRNYHLVDVSREVAEIAHEIRDYYQRLNHTDGLPKIKVPDAIHIATAIAFQCDRVFTFDERLIRLSPVIAGKYSLVIEKPRPTQLRMPMPAIKNKKS